MLRAGHCLMLIAAILLTFGVVMVNSAGLSVDAGSAVGLQSVLTGRHAMIAR